ncbi:MAG: Stk1 family PASTA domain-containing Ser/Thr kinase [Actinomycetota bacterium]
MSLVGKVFSNRYEIEREIAQGGMAEVYLARDRLLDRPVALKALFPEYAREPSFVERFRREAQAAANLNHPNIVAIYDWGQETGTYFIVMEYVEGRSLRDLIRSEGPLEAHQAAEITAEIAGALAFAHRTGVVHRDVKPGNVLLTRSGAVKVTDFGIARAGTSDGLTQTGSVMGTATYFSPEQAQGLAVDGRSDVYSLGVVLYEMVTGVVPFTGDSPVAVAYKHVREEPVPPSRRNPDVPADLEKAITTALAKDADHRYQTADDLRADLLRFRRGRPLAAAPVTAIVAEVPGAGAAAGATAAAATAAYGAAQTMQAPRVPPGGPPYYGGGLPPVGPPSRRRALSTALTVLVLIVVVAAIIFVSALAGQDSGDISVPEVLNMPEAEAIERLERAGLEGAAELVANDTVAEGIVFDQDPDPGNKLDRGDTVDLKVSAGAGEVEVPDLVGETQTDAETALTEAELEFEIEYEPSDEISGLLVIRTEPEGGELAARGSTVRLIVSSGREQVPIPNVDNLPEEEAATIISDADFVERRVSESSDTIPSGTVIRTEPAGGTQAPKGSAVRIIVSTGPAGAVVPQLLGLTRTQAEQALDGLGLTYTVLSELSPGNEGLVIRQSRADGEEVPLGTTIVLTVGSVTAATTTTSAPTPST